MNSTLVAALHAEERSIIAELRASVTFQRLEGIHKLLALYDAQPSIAVSFDAPAEPDRNAAPRIQLASPAPSAPIAMPGPTAAPVAAPTASGAGSAAPATASNTPLQAEEASGVVSSVRAALLGIGNKP